MERRRHDGGLDDAASDGDAAHDGLELLTFRIGGKRLALPVRHVVEVTQAVAIGAVPTGPPILEGIIDYRGRTVPVLDARTRLRVPPRSPAVDEHMLVTRVGDRVAVLRVDRALRLVRVDPRLFEAAEAAVPEAGLAAGVVRLPDGLLAICDLERFLDPAEDAAIDEALRSPSEADPASGQARQ